MPVTITEGLAEIKLIKAKIEKKKAFILNFIARQDGMRDPLQAQGGSIAAISEEKQSIQDLLSRMVLLRSKIAAANTANSLSVGDTTKTVADWLVWRRDASPIIVNLQGMMLVTINTFRNEGKRKGASVVSEPGTGSPQDIVVNVNEQELSQWQEKTAEILGLLDGKLSLHNATVTIEI